MSNNIVLKRLLQIQKDLKENKIKISDLTDKELDEMINLYKIQTDIKKKKLKEYRDKFVNLKKIMFT